MFMNIKILDIHEHPCYKLVARQLRGVHEHRADVHEHQVFREHPTPRWSDVHEHQSFLDVHEHRATNWWLGDGPGMFMNVEAREHPFSRCS